ncbi:MAG: glycosyltransferase family 4 protein [Anaerolineales bacterium]|nr:glycosyltransferase family 4 protein [Anaerolineales bacterium]
MNNNFQLRVAMLIQAYYPRLGGAERQLASLAPLLKERNIEICILTRRYDATLPAFEIIGETPVYRLPVPGPKPLAALSFSFSALPMLRRFNPHVIHAHELLSPATTAVMAKRIFGTPIVAKVLRGGELGDLAKLKNRAFGARRIASLKRGIDSFIVISSEIDRELSEIGVPPERRIFIPNGVDLNRFAPLPAERKAALRQSLRLPDGLIVAFTGRLDPEKRVHHLIEMWRSVLERRPDATLLILGAGTEEQNLKQKAGANVRFEGNVKDVAPYLCASDIFVLPSATEGLSNSLLEAMASGLPSIATSVGGATDIIEDGANGILIQPDDAQELRAALFSLLSDADARARLGAKGRETIAQKYSLTAVADKLSALYRRLASQSNMEAA